MAPEQLLKHIHIAFDNLEKERLEFAEKHKRRMKMLQEARDKTMLQLDKKYIKENETEAHF